MNNLITTIEECSPGQWLKGYELQNKINLPVEIIRAFFKIYESKGYGILSKENGTCSYKSNA
jgi:hypothetical protein